MPPRTTPIAPKPTVPIDRAAQIGLGKLQKDAKSVRYFPGAGPIAAFTMLPSTCVRPEAFFDRYATDFGIRAGLDTVVPDAVQRPPGLRVHQEFKGVGVLGRGYVFHSRADGCVEDGTGHLVLPLIENTVPRVTAETARRTAFQRVGMPLDPSLEGRLALMPGDEGHPLPGTYRLTWMFHPREYEVAVDAEDGGVLSCSSDIMDGPGCPASTVPTARPRPAGQVFFAGQFDVTLHLDGTLLGYPPRTDIAIAPGRHTLLLEREAARETRTIELEERKRLIVNVELR